MKRKVLIVITVALVTLTLGFLYLFTKPSAPLSEEDSINRFFHLIDENLIPEAIGMLDTNMAPDDRTRQIWDVQFNDIKSVNVQNVSPYEKEKWSKEEHKFKVTLEIYVSSDAADAPIPYYGWHDNPNIRWISLRQENGQWKITEISTGP